MRPLRSVPTLWYRRGVGRLVIGRFAELEDALVERVLELKRGQALAPVTVVVGSGAVRTRVGDLLVRRLGAVANVEIVTLSRLAADLVARWHGAAPPVLAGLARERLVRRLVAERRARGLAYFGPVSERPHFAQALAATFTDLREALVPPGPGWATVAMDAQRGAGRHAKATDLEELYAAYCAELDRRGLADAAELDLRAARVAAEGMLGAAVVYGVYDLNQAQETLVAALLDAGADLLSSGAARRRGRRCRRRAAGPRRRPSRDAPGASARGHRRGPAGGRVAGSPDA